MDVDPGEYKYENYVAPPRVRKVDEFGRSYGTGKKKTSIARVWASEGSGRFIVNGAQFSDYFASYTRVEILKAFLASETGGMFDINCTVKGGGE